MTELSNFQDELQNILGIPPSRSDSYRNKTLSGFPFQSFLSRPEKRDKKGFPLQSLIQNQVRPQKPYLEQNRTYYYEKINGFTPIHITQFYILFAKNRKHNVFSRYQIQQLFSVQL